MIKKRTAFTLLETVMVILVLGIMVALAVPGMVDIVPLRMDMAAKRMQADIRYAQSLAISTQRWTGIAFSSVNDNYTIYIDSTGTTPSGWTLATNPLTKEAYTVELDSGDFTGVDIALVFFNAADRYLVFDRWGNPYSYTGAGAPAALNNPAGVRLSTGFDTKDIRVERGTGRSYIQ